MGLVFIPKLEQYFQKKGLISLILLLVARYFNITWCIQNVQLFVQNNNSTCHCTPKTICIWSCKETKCIVHFTKKGWSATRIFSIIPTLFSIISKQTITSEGYSASRNRFRYTHYYKHIEKTNPINKTWFVQHKIFSD